MKKYINGDVDLYKLGLTILPNLQEVTILGNFYCNDNNLTTLEGCPEEVYGNFYCGWNDNLISLKWSPKRVGRNFDCSSNNLTSLEGCPEEVEGFFNCANNPGKFTEQQVRAVCKVKGEVFF